MKPTLIYFTVLLSACSPLQGEWSGTCSANGDWSLQLTSLSSHNSDMAGAEQPSEWDTVHGTAIITPTLGDLATGTATLWMCDPFYAPCTYLEEDGDLIEVEADYIQGTISQTGATTPSMRFMGEFISSDTEIEGSCYNLISGGAGTIVLNR